MARRITNQHHYHHRVHTRIPESRSEEERFHVELILLH